MNARKPTRPTAPAPKKKMTRAERTAGERVQQHRQRERRKQKGPPWVGIIGGGATILIILIILVHAAMSSGSSGGGKSLTDPNALTAVDKQFKPGTIAPDFTLKDLAGHSYTLAAQRGHPVLLEFFAVWCPHCQAEALTMAKLTSTYGARGVTVWSILANPYGPNYDNSNGTDLTLAQASDLTWFARTFKVHHPQLVDPKFKVVNTYGAGAYPTLYVIGNTGRVVYSTSGQTPYKTLATSIDKALGGKA